jgi:hypothetical protein
MKIPSLEIKPRGRTQTLRHRGSSASAAVLSTCDANGPKKLHSAFGRCAANARAQFHLSIPALTNVARLADAYLWPAAQNRRLFSSQNNKYVV